MQAHLEQTIIGVTNETVPCGSDVINQVDRFKGPGFANSGSSGFFSGIYARLCTGFLPGFKPGYVPGFYRDLCRVFTGFYRVFTGFLPVFFKGAGISAGFRVLLVFPVTPGNQQKSRHL